MGEKEIGSFICRDNCSAAFQNVRMDFMRVVDKNTSAGVYIESFSRGFLTTLLLYFSEVVWGDVLYTFIKEKV